MIWFYIWYFFYNASGWSAWKLLDISFHHPPEANVQGRLKMLFAIVFICQLFFPCFWVVRLISWELGVCQQQTLNRLPPIFLIFSTTSFSFPILSKQSHLSTTCSNHIPPSQVWRNWYINFTQKCNGLCAIHQNIFWNRDHDKGYDQHWSYMIKKISYMIKKISYMSIAHT